MTDIEQIRAITRSLNAETIRIERQNKRLIPIYLVSFVAAIVVVFYTAC